ncbi:MAG: HD domain-containing protein [Victivallales bacterium]|nr:HD domain-containing protein [Victivallales bacterium]
MDYSKSILVDFETKFSNYADSFLTDDIEFDQNILLKKEHSLLVCQESKILAETEDFSPRMAALIEIAALFHDIGRFEQIREFNTFVDCKSVDHGDLGCEVLIKINILATLAEKDQNIILASTKNHNNRELAQDLGEDALVVLKAVRDADKLDIMRILLKEYAKKRLDETIILHLDESDDVSPNVMKYLRKNKTPDISDFRTLTDFQLAQLAWIYDLNFKHSLYEFKKREFYEKITNLLPDTPQINKICKQMQNYLEDKTKK